MKIGISQRILECNNNFYDALDQSWYRFLKDHEIYPIPNRIDQNFKDIALTIDRLIISGGDDSLLRNKVEIELIKEMIRNCKPILGICHGAFLLTDLLSGKTSSCEDHHNVFHNVKINDNEYIVNSFHKLKIDKAPLYSSILATDLDGYCESWIYKNISAIVWHPERMDNPFVPKEILDNFFK